MEEERKTLLDLIGEACTRGCRLQSACHFMGISIRTIQNWKKYGNKDGRKGAPKNVPRKLSVEIEKEIIKTACSKRFIDKPPHVIVPLLAQEGVYLASESSFNRVLHRYGMMKDRREQRESRKSERIEIKANGPDELWSWDITYLSTCVKGQYYYLYMFMDIWSRYITGWEVYDVESGEFAKELFTSIANKRNVRGITLHSDNGSPMRASTLRATLERLGVTPSYSRPRVSNDNPYSESLFKTLKYTVGYPRQFRSLEEARAWVERFVRWYNHEHIHSGIGHVSPNQRMTGEDIEIFKNRNETYQKAYMDHPERWSGKLKQWEYKTEVILKKGNYKKAS